MNRTLLKENAKIALKRNFWLVMLVVLVAQLLGVSDINVSSGASTPSSSSTINAPSLDLDDFEEFEDFENKGEIIATPTNSIQTMSTVTVQPMSLSAEEGLFAGIAAMSIGIIIVVFVIIFALAIVWATFISGPVEIGFRRFFMLNRNNQGQFKDLFFALSPDYLNIVKGMFMTNLIIFGWSCLFIIPGIIKGYQYFFVPFILSENPKMSGARAREISTKMTDGYKWSIFVLGLSFIGWIIVGSIVSVIATLITCCLFGIGGILAFLPLAGYVSATYAELYAERREYALVNGIVGEDELLGYQVQDVNQPIMF